MSRNLNEILLSRIRLLHWFSILNLHPDWRFKYSIQDFGINDAILLNFLIIFNDRKYCNTVDKPYIQYQRSNIRKNRTTPSCIVRKKYTKITNFQFTDGNSGRYNKLCNLHIQQASARPMQMHF
jgi:hypothetical protein